MNDAMVAMPQFDRTVEDLGNIVELGHVNVTVPDQSKATAYYLMGLGLTRDPYLMAGLENMWVNVGRGQFHLPTREPQVVRGTTALVLPDLEALLKRLDYAKKYLEGTKFSFREAGDVVETTCPWGNRIRVHAPTRRGSARCASACRMSNSTCRLPPSLEAIARFYREILGGIAGVAKDERGEYAWASCSGDCKVTYRPTSKKLPEYDGHHIQITLADFSGPHKKLVERGLISRGKRPAPVPLPRHRRCGHQQADLPHRARDAQHASPDVQPHVHQPQPGHEQSQLRAGLRSRPVGVGLTTRRRGNFFQRAGEVVAVSPALGRRRRGRLHHPGQRPPAVRIPRPWPAGHVLHPDQEYPSRAA